MAQEQGQNPLQVLFMGTGTSSGLPLTPCLTLSAPYPQKWSDLVPILQDRPTPQSTSTASVTSSSANSVFPGSYDPEGPWPKNIPCACCRSSVDPDVPEGWKNKRGNTSVVLRKKNAEGVWKNVLVDVGKSFREQAMRLFPKWGVKTVDAVLLTHGHADAYFGLDDLREWCERQGRAIPVYLNRETFGKVEEAFPYMVDKTKVSGGGDVPKLIWKIIEDEGEFEVEGIDVKVLPVHHGIYFNSVLPPTNTQTAHDPPVKSEPLPLICLAFEFDESVIYMSDVSHIPERTWKRMLEHSRSAKRHTLLPTPAETPDGGDTPRGGAPPKSQSLSDLTNLSISPRGPSHLAAKDQHTLPVLIIDALWPTKPHASHFSLAQALAASLRLKAANTYVIGSTHPTSHFMWEEVCRSLQDPDGRDYEVREHPDMAQAEWIVRRVWDKVFGEGGDAEGLGERWREEGGRVRPGYDGLVLEVGGDKGVERADLSGRPLSL
ncbi:hypothetical protein I350_03014 [Cryptococcus amylolentus CBS 6273]|uniref:Metallo-beta-lactamase domain-containing protein n=1 Tax=Cryptococcus amylolentus CBS 6273 TaxID=1296118 RepID=A0A1E3K897_9TREE|nr:hypothetical protein I350_03014 [Cryptococcus amylolentus CBS 6273]